MAGRAMLGEVPDRTGDPCRVVIAGRGGQPGRMGLDDQVAAFAAASHVVAVHGAALANLVFCPPGAHVLEIFPVGQGTWSYAIFTPTLRLDYATMVSPEAGGDVTVDLDELRRWVGDVEA